MLTSRFETLFGELVVAFVRYQDASRNAADVVELARRRFELEAVRSAIAHERTVIECLIPTPFDEHWLADIGVASS